MNCNKCNNPLTPLDIMCPKCGNMPPQPQINNPTYNQVPPQTNQTVNIPKPPPPPQTNYQQPQPVAYNQPLNTPQNINQPPMPKQTPQPAAFQKNEQVPNLQSQYINQNQQPQHNTPMPKAKEEQTLVAPTMPILNQPNSNVINQQVKPEKKPPVNIVKNQSDKPVNYHQNVSVKNSSVKKSPKGLLSGLLILVGLLMILITSLFIYIKISENQITPEEQFDDLTQEETPELNVEETENLKISLENYIIDIPKENTYEISGDNLTFTDGNISYEIHFSKIEYSLFNANSINIYNSFIDRMIQVPTYGEMDYENSTILIYRTVTNGEEGYYIATSTGQTGTIEILIQGAELTHDDQILQSLMEILNTFAIKDPITSFTNEIQTIIPNVIFY